MQLDWIRYNIAYSYSFNLIEILILDIYVGASQYISIFLFDIACNTVKKCTVRYKTIKLIY